MIYIKKLGASVVRLDYRLLFSVVIKSFIFLEATDSVNILHRSVIVCCIHLMAFHGWSVI